MMKKSFITVIIILLIGAGGFVIWHQLSPSSDITITPVRSTIIQAVYATGEVEPVFWSKVSTQIAGKIEEIYVKEGQNVTKGQPLAKLEDSVECAKASEYMARLQYLEKEKERYQSLSTQDYASKSRYDQIVGEYDATQAQLDAQNKLVDRMLIKSPLSGVVLKRDAEPGETVTLSNIMFWIGEPKQLRITAEVDEEDIGLVRVGQRTLIKADAYPDKQIEGVVSEVTPKGDPVDKNFRVRIALPEDTPLLIGMTVEVNIIVKEKQNVLVIPSDSVIDGNVWAKEGRRFKKRGIDIGITNERYTEVIDGLSEDEEVLVSPSKQVMP